MLCQKPLRELALLCKAETNIKFYNLNTLQINKQII